MRSGNQSSDEKENKGEDLSKPGAEQEKILALSFDMDGCMLYGLSEKVTKLLKEKSLKDAIQQGIMECHQDFIENILKQIEQGGYTKVVIMSGSARQTLYHEKKSGKQNEKKDCIDLSSFPVLQGIQVVFQSKISVPVELDRFLLTDTFDGVDSGTTFNTGLFLLNERGEIEEVATSGDVPASGFSTYQKVELVYAQTNRLALKYKDQEIDYRLYDDHRDVIIQPLIRFYSANPHFLPEKVKIQGFQYVDGFAGGASSVIKGRGVLPSAPLNFFNFRLLFDFEINSTYALDYTTNVSQIRSTLFEAHPGDCVPRVVTEEEGREAKKLSVFDVVDKQSELQNLLHKLKLKKDITSVCQYKKVHYALEYLEKNAKEIDAGKIEAIDSLCKERKYHYPYPHVPQNQIEVALADIMVFNNTVGILCAPARSVEERTWWQERSPLTKAVIVGVVAAILVGAALTGVGLIVEAALGVSIVGASLFIGAGSFFSMGAFSTGIAAGGIGAAVVSGVSSFVSGIFYYIKQSCFPSPDAGVGNRDVPRGLASHPQPAKVGGGSGITYVHRGILGAPDSKDSPASIRSVVSDGSPPPPVVGAHSLIPTTGDSHKPKKFGAQS